MPPRPFETVDSHSPIFTGGVEGSFNGAGAASIGLELLYSLSLYYLFFGAVVVSDLFCISSLAGLLRIDTPGPYTLVWGLAMLAFMLQLVLALAYESEDKLVNILLVPLMYFTYCQLWIPVVAWAFYDDAIMRRPMKWAKTVRFEVPAAQPVLKKPTSEMRTQIGRRTASGR